MTDPASASPFVRTLRDGDWLNPRRARWLALLMIAVTAYSYIRWLAGTQHGYDPETLKPIAADFTSFWIAARAAVAGTPALAYDMAAHTAAQLQALAYPPGAAVPIVTWSYPPTYLLLVAPFGLLPLTASFAVWIGLTTALFVAVIKWTGPRTESWLPVLLALGFSGVQANLYYGQNGALTASLFGLGLLWLERRPWLAGACFALLTVKPQLGVMLPVALLAGGHGRSIAATVVCTAVLALLSLLAFGADTWLAFFGTLGWSRHALLDEGAPVWGRMPSLFAALRLAGAPLPLAYAGQAVLSLAAAIAVWRIWRIWRSRTDYPAKAASVAFGTLAATPYLLNYDLVLLGIGMAWLVRGGVARGFPPWSPLLIAIAWYAPAISAAATPVAVPFVPVLCLALLGVLLRAAGRGRQPVSPG